MDNQFCIAVKDKVLQNSHLASQETRVYSSECYSALQISQNEAPLGQLGANPKLLWHKVSPMSYSFPTADFMGHANFMGYYFKDKLF